jgi:hypothetical protein
MPVVTLDQYAQVKTASGTPKTTYRPSLAYLEKGSILYMAYPGQYSKAGHSAGFGGFSRRASDTAGYKTKRS